jgi:hypothetical protein
MSSAKKAIGKDSPDSIDNDVFFAQKAELYPSPVVWGDRTKK